MTMKKRWACVAAGALFAALILPVLGQEVGVRIKVIVENSSLRVKPNMDSEILEENVPLGTVFEKAKKSGEWYEVKYQSKLGVMITGYIHEMYVEVMAAVPPIKPAEPTAKPAEPPVKPAVKPAVQPQALPRYGAEESGHVEFGLAYGLGLGTPASATTSYDRDVAVAYVLVREEGRGTLSHTLKAPQGLALSVAYYFPVGLGVQLRADVNFKQKITGNTTFDMDALWNDGDTFSRHASFPLSGEASLMPFSLDLVYRISAGEVFHPYLGAGLTYFIGKFTVSSSAGFPFWFLFGGYQNLDWVVVPVEIDKSLNGFGGNFMAGFDIKPTPNIALTVGGIYFLGKEFSFNWSAVPGSYPCQQHTSFTLTFPQVLANSFAADFTSLKVKTSHFKFMTGIKVGF